MNRHGRDRALRPGPLLEAYARGAFPMDAPEDAGGPVPFYTADPRAVIPVAHFRVPRSVARAIRRTPYEVRIDAAFTDVLRACADRDEGTWLSPRLIDAYTDLHRVGNAHSVECWHAGRLVGGLFGVTLGGLFTGESMFHHAPDAGNQALVATGLRLRERGYTLWDIQMATDHTARFGAVWIDAAEYRARLAHALGQACRFTP